MSEAHFKYDETLKLSKAVGVDPDMRQILENILTFVKKKDNIDLSGLETTVQNLSKKLDGMSGDISKIYKKLEEYEEPEAPYDLPELEDRTISFATPLAVPEPTPVLIPDDELDAYLVDDDIHDQLKKELASEMEEEKAETVETETVEAETVEAETPAPSPKKSKAKKKAQPKEKHKRARKKE